MARVKKDTESVDIEKDTESVDVDFVAEAIHDFDVEQLRKAAQDAGLENVFQASKWDELTETSKENRRALARFLVDRFIIQWA